MLQTCVGPLLNLYFENSIIYITNFWSKEKSHSALTSSRLLALNAYYANKNFALLEKNTFCRIVTKRCMQQTNQATTRKSTLFDAFTLNGSATTFIFVKECRRDKITKELSLHDGLSNCFYSSSGLVLHASPCSPKNGTRERSLKDFPFGLCPSRIRKLHSHIVFREKAARDVLIHVAIEQTSFP
jgi:hypothetical protein